MNIEYLKFISWTALWAWILSDTFARYAIPYLEKFYNILDEIKKTGSDKEKSKQYLLRAIALSIEIIFSLCLAYVLMSWSVWCLLRCVLYTQGNDTTRWVFFISGFLCCELALGKAANACPRKNFLSVFPYIMSMGAFIVFSLNYEPIRTTFPWMMDFVGLKL